VNQEFSLVGNVHVNRDDRGIVRELLHTDEPFVSAARTPQLAAAEYLDKYGTMLGITPDETRRLGLSPEREMAHAAGELRFQAEKQQFDMTTVAYQQTHSGLPIWHAGVAVHMKQGPFRVISSQSTRHPDVEVERPSNDVMARLLKLDAGTLRKQLGLTATDAGYDPKTLAIEGVKLVIYQYASEKRVIVEKPPADANVFGHRHATLPLPPVAEGIADGRHYVSAEVNFALTPRGQDVLHWVAIVEAETLSVLYLRAFVDDVNGQVFLDDPITTNGGPGPGATTASLNLVRTSVLLQGLTVSSPQALTGANVQLVDAESPAVASPTEPGGMDFNFNSRTNNFAAVNAYYHCDRFFRLVQGMGFNLGTYFGGATAFPNPVDHRGSILTTTGVEVNAHCVGTSGGAGIARTTFALADLGDTANPIGIACDFRVVLHELGGHGVLYPHVHSANFGFAHSAGDSVAAITCDPDTHAPDRFVTFPWVNIGRRHDRTVASGWGWADKIGLHPFDPVLDSKGYNNEQILCTTMFRFYLSIGGGSTNLGARQFAARFAVYLILRAIGSLTPATNPSNAAGFATALMTADLGDWTSEGHSGGAYGKVIRWAFEKQGLFQPAGTPTPNNNEGAPPAVDVYIDDGRHGEYPYQPHFWSCQGIWNRRLNDGGTTHEEPVVGVTNFAWVKIKNRGTQAATKVVVRAFHANPAAGLVYPDDWQPMSTAQLSAPDVGPNNTAEIAVGPFEWVPTQVGHECMFMIVSAAGDPSNISNMTAGDSIPEWRLVPNDNNIGQRNVFPVSGSGLRGLLASLDQTRITIKNPHNVAARMTVTAVLPRFLAATGWGATFENPGSNAFSLRPGEAKVVVLRLKPGKDFTGKDVLKAKDDATIHVEARANDIVVGGMSYTLDPQWKAPTAGRTTASRSRSGRSPKT
jgi:hypothetical protein